jgi:hypothetical protein
LWWSGHLVCIIRALGCGVPPWDVPADSSQTWTTIPGWLPDGGCNSCFSPKDQKMYVNSFIKRNYLESLDVQEVAFANSSVTWLGFNLMTPCTQVHAWAKLNFDAGLQRLTTQDLKSSIFCDIMLCSSLKVNLLLCWFFGQLILRPWRWMQHVPPTGK